MKKSLKNSMLFAKNLSLDRPLLTVNVLNKKRCIPVVVTGADAVRQKLLNGYNVCAVFKGGVLQ